MGNTTSEVEKYDSPILTLSIQDIKYFINKFVYNKQSILWNVHVDSSGTFLIAKLPGVWTGNKLVGQVYVHYNIQDTVGDFCRDFYYDFLDIISNSYNTRILSLYVDKGIVNSNPVSIINYIYYDLKMYNRYYLACSKNIQISIPTIEKEKPDKIVKALKLHER